MKRIVISPLFQPLLFVVLLLSAPRLYGQNITLPRVQYDNVRTEWSGDSLRVSFRVRITGTLPEGSLYLGIEPVLGSVRMPGISYQRKSEYRYYRRRHYLSWPRAESGYARQLLTPRGGGSVSSEYYHTLLVPRSYGGQTLRLETCVYGCSERFLAGVREVRVPQHPSDTVPAVASLPGMLPAPVLAVSLPLYESNVTFLEPHPEERKERTEHLTIRLTYPVNRSEVLSDFEQNATELARIDRVLRPMVQDGHTYRICSGHIVGYASPEDTYAHNLRLSERRADGMRQWLVGHYGLCPDSLTVHGAGEDWTSLRTLVSHSNMRYRDEVLSIIDGYGIWAGREKRLMDLRGGEPYKYMLRNFFPPLRRMELDLVYTVRSFSQEEAEAVLSQRPQDLSQQEIYTVARERNTDMTIQRSRTTYGFEYDIAVRYFPNDAIANINASSAALVRGDLVQAKECLDRVKDDPLAANNLGIYYWLCGDAVMARSCFERAQSVDPVRAEHNLAELSRWEQEQGVAEE